MNEVLTIAEIHERFPSEWVLLDKPQTDKRLGVLGGTLLCHSKDRDDVSRKALEVPVPRHIAVLYTGPAPAPRGEGPPMTVPFDPQQGLIVVAAVVEGPTGAVELQLALDTGATDSVIGADWLLAAGYDPAASPNAVLVVTGSGVASVSLLTVSRLTALGQDRLNFSVLGHTLPPSTSVDGVLGLDFLRGHALNIDFRTGQITLT